MHKIQQHKHPERRTAPSVRDLPPAQHRKPTLFPSDTQRLLPFRAQLSTGLVPPAAPIMPAQSACGVRNWDRWKHCVEVRQRPALRNLLGTTLAAS